MYGTGNLVLQFIFFGHTVHLIFIRDIHPEKCSVDFSLCIFVVRIFSVVGFTPELRHVARVFALFQVFLFLAA